jgi:hypothetical protein
VSASQRIDANDKDKGCTVVGSAKARDSDGGMSPLGELREGSVMKGSEDADNYDKSKVLPAVEKVQNRYNRDQNLGN